MLRIFKTTSLTTVTVTFSTISYQGDACHMTPIFKLHALTLPILALGLVLASCGDDVVEPVDLSGTFFSTEQGIGNGSAKLFVTRDADGVPTAYGFRIEEAALSGLDSTDLSLGFEMLAEGSEIPVKYATLDWNPHGHEPAMIFDVPHFDMHFYTMTRAELDAEIDPSDADFQTKADNFPGADYIPADYIVPGPPGAPAEAIPGMGVHWVDSKDPLAPGSFTEVLIYGTWDGDLTFIEPMMTVDWMKTKATVSESVKQPAKYQIDGYWPTTYTVAFDTATNEYVVTMGGLVKREAS